MISKDRRYKNFEVKASQDEGMIVEGYAVVFNQSETMYSIDGIDYKEEIDRNAFSNTKMSDVVLNYNHEGKPFGRTKNGTLQLSLDDYGLKIRADLSGTKLGQETYDEIKGGYLDKMSFAFTVNQDGEEYDRASHLRRITGIERLYDVSIVDIPAYNTTSVYARSFFEAEAEKDRVAEARKQALINRRNKLKDLMKGAE